MIYNILDYGAVPDGQTNSAAAIQAAIDACSKIGGIVLVPAGHFLSGFIQLRSNVELHLESGAVLISDLNDEEARYFLYAYQEKNIVISGNGMIDGQGRMRFVDDNADGEFHECPLMVVGNRPRTSYFEAVENLTVCGVTFYDAAFWTLHMAGCKNVLVESVRILNNDRGPNNDGIDPDCCQNVIIRNCMIDTGDDAIVVKTTEKMAERYGNCENIVIHGCILHSRDSALKIGTETYGDIRHIILSDCVIDRCSRAIGIWSRDGGVISDIHIHHLTGNVRRYADCPQRDFAPRWWGKGEPVFISATQRKDGKRIPGKIKDVYMDHLYLQAESSVFLAGESYAPIEHVIMKNVEFHWKNESLHKPDVFDEQPSKRDVYNHEISCVYGRNANDIWIEGYFDVEESLQQTIQKREILEECNNFIIKECR